VRKDHSPVVDASEEGEKGKELSFVVNLAAQKRNTPPPGVSAPGSVLEAAGLGTAPRVLVSAAAEAAAGWPGGWGRTGHLPLCFRNL